MYLVRVNLVNIVFDNLRGEHLTYPSPEYPVGQEHCGLWFITRHSAPGPHASLHGFTQVRSIQALSGPHSSSL